jgi:aminomethyltransferase
MLRTTPFHDRTGPLSEGQSWRRWAGHVVASSYDLLHDREYAAIRNSAALIDVSPLFKYLVGGRDATRFLDRVVTRHVAKAGVGQVLYTPWCDSAGKVIDDGTISRLDEDRYRMTSADPNLRWLRQNALGLGVTIEDVSDATAALSLQGPLSRDILAAAGCDVTSLRYFHLTGGRLAGVPVTVSRTGYTGDLGFEIWIPAAHALEVWGALLAAGANYGIVPAGIRALVVARGEAGLRLMDALAADGALAGYHLLPAARADLLRRLGRLREAADAYREALALVGNDADRRFLERRLAQVAPARS